MSSITVQVIFMGLIGFVPQENDMTALMVDPDPKGKNEHIPYVLLLDGTCTRYGGSCFRECDNFKSFDDSSIKPPEMCWKLHDEDLRILGNGRGLTLDSTGYKTVFGNPKEVPTWKWQANDFAWVPGTELLTGGYGKVRDDCLADGKPCDLVRARMKVPGGHATACHLIHELQERGYDGERREVIRFPYDVGAKTIYQAVADAAQVEFQVEGDKVFLHSWEFRASDQQPHKQVVALKPPPGRPLTLIVTNFPSDPREHEFHAAFLLKLLALAPPYPPTRTDCNHEPCETRRRHPGSCEAEATRIADLFEAALGNRYVHSPTYCDGLAFR